MNGFDAAPAADVIGHVLAHTDRAIHGAQHGRLALAGKGAVGTEGHGQRGARQVHHAGVGARSAASSSSWAGSSVEVRMISGRNSPICAAK